MINNNNKSLTKEGKQEVSSLIQKALKKKEWVKYKYYESLVSSNITSTGYIQCLTPIVQGSTDSNRIGDYCRATRLQMNFAVSGGSLSSGAINRVVIFQWNEDDNDTIPTTVTQILNTNSAVGCHNFDAIRQKKVSILYDKLIGTEADWHGQVCIQLDKSIDRKMNFTSSGQYGYGKLYILLMGTATGTPPSFVGYCHITFNDTPV
jgi:hypothetical protein